MFKFTIDLFCIGIILILLFSIHFQAKKLDKTTARFSIFLHMVIGFFIFNFISNILEGKTNMIILSYIINLLSFIFVDCIIISFSLYLSTLMGTIDKKWSKILNPGVFFTYVRVIVIFVIFSIGKLFTIDNNGCYKEESLVSIPYYFSGAIMVMLLLVVIRNRKHFTSKQMFVISTYLILPIPFVITEMITNTYSLTTISMTLSVLLVYTMVQSSIIEDSRIRESILENISLTDMLTGLNNRRAYYNKISEIKSEDRVGILFCDINELKYINDNFGHSEGDKHIVRFSEILTNIFARENVFRISGDEFVVIIPGISQDEFNLKVSSIEKTIGENHYIAACGFAFGNGNSTEHLLSDAENIMYETKRRQYNDKLIHQSSRKYS